MHADPANRFKYVTWTSGDVIVIAGPVFIAKIARSPYLGARPVNVPTWLFGRVCEMDRTRAWAYWQQNKTDVRLPNE